MRTNERLIQAWTDEREAARAARGRGDLAGEWAHLERAHILSQPLVVPHIRTHLAMVSCGARRHDRREDLAEHRGDCSRPTPALRMSLGAVTRQRKGGAVLKEFRDFLMKGNIVDLAVAFVMGVAFGAVVNSLVNNLVMPIIAMIIGKPDFSGLTFTINDAVFRYGAFITDVIQFLAIAAAVFFFIVKPMNAMMSRMRKPAEEEVTDEERRLRIADAREHRDVLLAVGSALTPVAALFPPELEPKIMIPIGLALAWLGYALFAERREKASEPAPVRSAQPEPSQAA